MVDSATFHGKSALTDLVFRLISQYTSGGNEGFVASSSFANGYGIFQDRGEAQVAENVRFCHAGKKIVAPVNRRTVN